MIYHHNRITLKAGVSEDDRERALELLRAQGREIDAVRHFVVGRDVGGDYDWGAVFVVEDLDGLWEFLVHPAHVRTARVALPLVERFAAHDTSDDDDPQLGRKIAALHARRWAAVDTGRP